MALTASMSTFGECRVVLQTTTNGFYTPLLGQQDIRLLEVLPGDDESTIVTSMATVSLDSKPTYAALSYVWGDATQTSIIECNGKSISITTTLADALKAFRSFSAGPDAPLKRFQRIWADQICINQHDVLERNHQVGIMGSVYSSSACAFIWLGPGDEDSDRALTLIDSLHQISMDHVAIHLKGKDSSNERKEYLLNIPDLPEDMVLLSDDQAWAELDALFRRPWFHRSWTFQEPIRAPERMIACGSEVRGWNIFVHALCCIALQRRFREESGVIVIPFLTIHYFINEKPEDLRLSNLIYKTWRREASDPRDKVYALYGLVQAYQKVPLEISYAMSVEDVYRSTVRFCIENEGSLSILRYVSEFGNQSDLPSWVPDWRDRPDSGCLPVNEGEVPKFRASSMSRPLLVPSSSNDKLILKGFILAIVEQTIDIAALKFNAADSFPESWITNAAAAGVPVRFLQGKTFQTSYDITMMMENSPFHSEFGKDSSTSFWTNSTSWIAAGHLGPIPQAVLTEYKEGIDRGTSNRRLFLTKDSLGLAPAPTQRGDRICILLGSNVPFVLRPRQDTARTTPSKEAETEHQNMSGSTPQDIANLARHGSTERARVAKQAIEATEWTLIGDCYLHGYMRGEAMETVTEADYVNFTLV